MRLLLERIAVALERIAESQSGQGIPQWPVDRPAESKCVQAMKLLAEMGPDNLAAIAKAVGVSRSSLYRWPTFMEAAERLRAGQTWAVREPRAARPGEI